MSFKFLVIIYKAGCCVWLESDITVVDHEFVLLKLILAGRNHVSMQLPKTLSGLTDFLFNKRCAFYSLPVAPFLSLTPFPTIMHDFVFLLLLNIYSCRNLDQVSMSRRKPLRPGKVSPPRPVPAHIQRPPYVKSRRPPEVASGAEVHDERGIECMRASGRLAALVLEYAGTLVKVILQCSWSLTFLSYYFSFRLFSVILIAVRFCGRT